MKKVFFIIICIFIVQPLAVRADDSIGDEVYNKSTPFKYSENLSMNTEEMVNKIIKKMEIKVKGAKELREEEVYKKIPQLSGAEDIAKYGDELTAIDGNCGWYLVNFKDTLLWCSSDDVIIMNNIESSYPKVLKVIKEKPLYKPENLFKIKKGQVVNILTEINGYYKVKNNDGFYGWINAYNTKDEHGIIETVTDVNGTLAADLTPNNKIGELEEGDAVYFIDEREEEYLIKYNQKLTWCSKNKIDLVDNNKGIIKSKVEIYEARSNYTYPIGSKIRILDGTDKDFLKVLTPKGDVGWISKENTSYDNEKNLIANSSLKVYFIGKNKSNFLKNDSKNLAQIALSQVGYKELNNNETKYGNWYGTNAEWCAIFVSWCAYNAGISQSVLPKHSYCLDGVASFMQNKCWYNKDQYTPKEGDIVYFYAGNDINHVGIVLEVTSDAILSIEGNMSDSVMKVKHNLNDKNIAGYGSPMYEK